MYGQKYFGSPIAYISKRTIFTTKPSQMWDVENSKLTTNHEGYPCRLASRFSMIFLMYKYVDPQYRKRLKYSTIYI